MTDYAYYTCGISPVYLNSTSELSPTTSKCYTKEEAIATVQSVLKNTYNVSDMTDEYVMRFLHARKMNVERTLQLIVNYVSYKKDNPVIFVNLSVSDPRVQLSIKHGLPVVLKNRDRNGRCVLLLLLYQWEPETYSVDSITRSLLLTLEYLLSDVENQVNGFVIVVDWNHMKFRNLKNFNHRLFSLMIKGLETSYPAKIKAIHFLSQPWFINTLFTLMKPFLKEKTTRKLFLHGTNLANLHEFLPCDVAPPELGGEGPVYKPDELLNLLREYENNHQLIE